MPTRAAYSIDGLLFNLLRRPTFKPLVHELDEVRPILRDGNGRHRTGSGARQRSSYEHEMDVIAYLQLATRVQGLGVTVIRHRCRRWKRRLTLATGRRTCRCAVVTIEPWHLVSAAVPATARAVHDMRRKLHVALDWLERNGPGSGWARRQSERRARQDERFTQYQLPRRSWPAFFLFRAVADVVVGMLVALWDWWETLITALRLAPKHPKGAEELGVGKQGERKLGAECSDRRAGWTRDLIRHVLPSNAM